MAINEKTREINYKNWSKSELIKEIQTKQD